MRRAALNLTAVAFVLLTSGLSGRSAVTSPTPAHPPGTAARAAGAAQAGTPFTVEEMLKLERLSDPQLSPDGARVAFVVTIPDLRNNSRRSNIRIVPVSGGGPQPLVSSDKSEDTPRWSPDGKRLAFVSARDGSSQVWMVEMGAAGKAGEPKKVTDLPTEASGVRWSPDAKFILFVSDVYPECDTQACNAEKLAAHEANTVKARVFDRLLFRHWVSWKEGRFSHLFLMPADGSAPPRDLTPGAADVPPFSLGGPDDYAVSPDSAEVAYVQKTDPVEAVSTNSDLFLLDVRSPGAKPRKITGNPGADGGPAYSPDGRFIAYRAQQRAGFESDRWRLMVYDRKSGEHRAISDALDRSVDSYAWTPDSQALFITIEDRGASSVLRLPVGGGEPTALLKDGGYSDVQVSRDGRTLVFTRSTLHEPTDLFRANADGTDVQAITRLNAAAMARYNLRPAESVWYEGAGGTKIQAWVVKPAGYRDGEKYPVIYLVHGGPQGAWNDVWGYRWNPQVFASRGYVVFMPNPRGSTGFGQQFTDEISGDWGGRVYDDLMKGADYAEALPYVERGRIGAAGASFGGYMMNWFLGHTDRFKALVSHAGVYNLTSMYGVTEELWFPEWDLKGTPWTNPEGYAKFSPHAYAKSFRTPTLVTHGELDFRVPIGEGLQLFTTLQRLEVPSRMVYFPDEGHWINKPGNSALWYHAFLDWMDQWVKGTSQATKR